MANVKPNGGEIRQARLKAGLKQEDLAKLVGVAKDTISRWERGCPAALHLLELLVTVFRQRGIAHGPLWTAEEDAEFRAVGWPDVREWDEWHGDGVALMRDIIQLDITWNPEWEGYQREFGTPEQWAQLCTKHPDMWQLIVGRDRKVVGHWHFLTLFDEEFARVKAGKWSERLLGESMVQPLVLPGVYNLYVVIIATAPDHRPPRKEGMLVFDSLLMTMERLAEGGFFFGEVCANAYTPDGAALCKNFSLTEVGGHRAKGRIWSGCVAHCVQRPIVKRNYPRLAELYESYFGS